MVRAICEGIYEFLFSGVPRNKVTLFWFVKASIAKHNWLGSL